MRRRFFVGVPAGLRWILLWPISEAASQVGDVCFLPFEAIDGHCSQVSFQTRTPGQELFALMGVFVIIGLGFAAVYGLSSRPVPPPSPEQLVAHHAATPSVSPVALKYLPPILIGLAPSAALDLDPAGVLA